MRKLISETHRFRHEDDQKLNITLLVSYDRKKLSLHGKNQVHDQFKFYDSDPRLVERVGELIAEAGRYGAELLERQETEDGDQPQLEAVPED